MSICGKESIHFLCREADLTTHSNPKVASSHEEIDENFVDNFLKRLT